MYSEGQFDDRVCNDCKPIPIKPLETNVLFRDGKPNWKLLREHFKHQGSITKEDAVKIINDAKAILLEEPNVCKLKDPVVIVGDLHGQQQDLLKVINLGGDPAQNNYLFMGDQVDRGPFSVEVILLVFAMKIIFKESLVLLRGNHESRTMTGNFDFKKQVEYKQDLETYEVFMNCFDALPLVCLLDKFVVLHGGISPEMNLDRISRLNRFAEVPKEGLMCDLLWADPIDEKKDEVKKGSPIENNKPMGMDAWAANDMRGCSYYYGKTVTRKFLDDHKLQTLVRAHEAQYEGFKFNQMYLQKTNKVFPQVITIFSAPNYCGYQGNYGSILKLKGTDIKIEKYGENKKPQVLPNVLDLFDWSLPFLTENITAVLKILLGGKEDNKLSKAETAKFRADVIEKIDKDFNKKEIIKKKIRFIGRLTRIFNNLRMKNLGGNNEKQSKEERSSSFNEKRAQDLNNEKFPTMN